jgi:hypothetical protein
MLTLVVAGYLMASSGSAPAKPMAFTVSDDSYTDGKAGQLFLQTLRLTIDMPKPMKRLTINIYSPFLPPLSPQATADLKVLKNTKTGAVASIITNYGLCVPPILMQL